MKDSFHTDGCRSVCGVNNDRTNDRLCCQKVSHVSSGTGINQPVAVDWDQVQVVIQNDRQQVVIILAKMNDRFPGRDKEAYVVLRESIGQSILHQSPAFGVVFENDDLHGLGHGDWCFQTLIQNAWSRTIEREEADNSTRHEQSCLAKTFSGFDQPIRIVAKERPGQIRHVEDCTILDSHVTGIFHGSRIAENSGMPMRAVGQHPDVVFGTLYEDVIAITQVGRNFSAQSVSPIRRRIQRLFHLKFGSK